MHVHSDEREGPEPVPGRFLRVLNLAVGNGALPSAAALSKFILMTC